MEYNQIFNRLSPKQQEICMHDKGFALVLAGPGSGKTTVTVARICRLAESYKQPEKILCQTFTVAAANEMKKRYMQYQTGKMPHFATTHSFCYGIVQKIAAAKDISYTVIDEQAAEKQLRSIYEKINNQKVDETISYNILSAISKSRHENGLMATQIKNFDDILSAYEKYKKKNNLIDFDDMIFTTKKILEEDQKTRKKIADKYEYVLLDEAQDMTEIQFEIIRLVAPHENIFVVADDDQSIYGFRGANPKNLMNFTEKYKNGKKYYLERNYRSTNNIVNLSSTIININKERYEKKLFTENTDKGRIEILAFKDSIEQARYICDEYKKQNGTTAVLYRNNSSAMILKACMTLQKIEYAGAKGTIKTYELPLITKYLEKVREKQRKAGFIIPTPQRAFKEMLKEGFEEYAENYSQITGQMKRYKNQTLSFLQYISKECRTLEEITGILDRIDSEKTEKNCRMSLSTVHASKGLEYDNVFLIDMVYDEFPGQNVSSPGQLEEERRLFYVAITRAKKNLTICYPQRRFNTEEKQSIFVDECKAICEQSGR